MSSSNMSINNADVDAFIFSSVTIYRVWSFLMIFLGTIGHSLSLYVFTRPSLISNPCSRYFLASTIGGFIVVCINMPTRLLQIGYNIDVLVYSLASCKILTFILYWTRALTPWFITMACVDRCLCSSPSVAIRAWSNVRVASRTTGLILLVVGLSYIHVPIFYQINILRHTCNPGQGIYGLFFGVWNMVIFSLGPPITMLVFGSLTIRHVRRSERRTVVLNTEYQNITALQPQQCRNGRDRQLMQMMLVQCAVFCITATPVSVSWIYTSVRSNVMTDALDIAKYNLFLNLTGFISIANSCTSFYLFTLSSRLFRSELKHLFNCRWQTNQNDPVIMINLKRRN